MSITVGALRTNGTLDRSDDEVAPWSSKGPTLIDHIVKPDLVAPGSKIVSAAMKTSTLAVEHPERFLDGPGTRDYMPLSGTSMAAAVDRELLLRSPQAAPAVPMGGGGLAAPQPALARAQHNPVRFGRLR